MKVYIIGTDHQFQTADGRAPAEAINAFRNVLASACETRSVAAIAEEMCLETVLNFGQRESVCLQEATRLGLKHRYCDPATEARKPLGIRKKSDLEMDVFHGRLAATELDAAVRREWAKREAFWLEELRDLDASPVLFVCGADHARPFMGLLETGGLEAEIVAADWSPNTPLQPPGYAGG